MKQTIRTYAALVLSLAAAALVATCSSDSRSPVEIVANARLIRAVSGNAQSGRALSQLRDPLSVQVLDNEGNPVPAFTVRFEVTSSQGVFAGSNQRSTEVVTNSSGLTSVYLVLGASADFDYTVQASAARPGGAPLQGSPVRFSARATSAADTTGNGGGGGGGGVPGTSSGFSMTGIALGADTLGSAGRFFKIPLAVHVVDSLGRGVNGLAVFYSAVEGGGVFDIAEKTTDTYGNAVNAIRLGYQVGMNLIQASAVMPDGSVLKAQWRIWSKLDPDVRHNAYNIVLPASQPDSLSAPVGSTLPLPLVVSVTDTFGRGSPNQPVTWTVESGGSLGSSVSYTSSEGIAQVTFKLDPNPGLNRVRATIIRDNGVSRSAYINVYGLPLETPVPAPDALVVISGDNQTAEVGQILPLPVTLAVLDAGGKRLPAVPVKLTITTPVSVPATDGGFIGEASEEVPLRVVLNLQSNNDGLVSFVWRLGPGPDFDNKVVAQITLRDGTLRSVQIRAQAMPRPDMANRLVILSGNYQSPQPVNTLLPMPLIVRVVDSTRTGVNGDPLGAPIPNFPVLFTAYSPKGDGVLDDSPGMEPAGTGRLTALTGTDGLAAVRWTTGTLTGGPDDPDYLRNNNYVVAVTTFADGSQDSVIFFTTAVPQAGKTMITGGSLELSGTAGKLLTLPTVNVTDQYGNVVSGTSVIFSIGKTPGAAQISEPQLYTNAYGNVTGCVDQLSTKSGEMKVSAANGSLGGSPITFTITVQADVAASLQRVGGHGQTSKAGTAWTNPLKVLVQDQYGNARPGQQVNFAVTAGSASFTELVLTDGSGFAETTATPNAEGNITITAGTLINGVNTTVSFSLTATAP